ncbi:hypothetical protein FKW77_002601 [Venturia effusa]|uniref:Uncharacterized protein n=1 Tax=Venturia effusa TaxID=50376 RepID=A0A517LDF6_9PEZI|nr:hypothetical protein FKW77_002601 [Venturia effusa]
MCANCGVNANCRTTTALTWAIPVDIVKLAAHLQVDHALKPTITAVQLCHRYGQGPHVFITRLPEELVDMVLHHVIGPARKTKEREWSAIKNCAEGLCGKWDHYTEEEILEIKMDLISDYDGEQCELDDYISDHVADMDATYERCEARRSDWETMTCVSKDFAPLDKMLEKEFGLSSHIAHHSMTMSMVRLYFPGVNKNQESVITQAYITLPYTRFTHVLNTDEVCSSDYVDYYDCQRKLSFFSVIDPTSLHITPEKLRRFHRALKSLDLAPSLNDVHVISLDHGHPDPVLSKHKDILQSSTTRSEGLEQLRKTIRKRLNEQLKSEWPKLMNLVKVSYEL